MDTFLYYNAYTQKIQFNHGMVLLDSLVFGTFQKTKKKVRSVFAVSGCKLLSEDNFIHTRAHIVISISLLSKLCQSSNQYCNKKLYLR